MALEEKFIKISVHAQAKINENPRQLCHNHLIPGLIKLNYPFNT